MSNGAITTVPYRAELNPPKDQPFTIEFWAKPSSSDNDDTTVFNRITTSPRAGWVFFQREESIGWNFRMHNGAGGTVGYDLTGGTYTVNSWSSAAASVIFGWFRCLGCWTKLGELSYRGWVVGVGGRRFFDAERLCAASGWGARGVHFSLHFSAGEIIVEREGGDADQMVRIISLCVSLDPVSLFRGISGALLLIHEDTFG